jgi:hypothetical protein
MDFELRFDENDEYITATLTGIRRPDTLIDAAAKTSAHCRDRGVFFVLIDVRGMSGGLDTMETFEVAGHEIPQQADTRKLVRSAILDHPENIKRIRFFETVAINRGLNVKVFDDEDRAIEWLQRET